MYRATPLALVLAVPTAVPFTVKVMVLPLKPVLVAWSVRRAFSVNVSEYCTADRVRLAKAVGRLATVTVWVAVVLLPAASVAVQVTVVTPSGNAAGALLETLVLQLSSATALPRATLVAVVWFKSTTVLMLAGAVMVGACVSCTVTVADAVWLLPCASVTVSTTVCGPSWAQVKLLGLTVIDEIPQLSELPLLIVVANKLAWPRLFNCTVAGRVRATGASLSVTVMLCT